MGLNHLKQNTMWPLKMLYTQIHTNLIHACDRLTALLPSVVKTRKRKPCHIERCHSKLPSFLSAPYTCRRIGNVKSEVELARPYFCTLAGLIISDL